MISIVLLYIVTLLTQYDLLNDVIVFAIFFLRGGMLSIVFTEENKAQ